MKARVLPCEPCCDFISCIFAAKRKGTECNVRESSITALLGFLLPYSFALWSWRLVQVIKAGEGSVREKQGPMYAIAMANLPLDQVLDFTPMPMGALHICKQVICPEAEPSTSGC